MAILSRHVFREFLPPLVYCLCGFAGIYILFELFGSFSRITEAKLPVRETVEYFAGYLSPFFHYLAPAALMLATLYTMWNLSRHSEITAMLAGGAGVSTVAAPLLLAATAMALFTAWVNECYMPGCAQWAKRLRSERFDLEKTALEVGFGYSNSAERRIWTVEGSHNRDCSDLRNVRISSSRPDGTREWTMKAERARWLDGEWWFDNVRTGHFDASERPCASPTPELDALPLRCFPQFRETPEDLLLQNSDIRFASTAGKLKQLEANGDLDAQSRNDVIYDAWAQALSPLACLIMTLAAIPGAARSGRRGAGGGIFGAIGTYFLYYAAVIACMALAKTGCLAPVAAAVAPPAVFGVWATAKLTTKGLG